MNIRFDHVTKKFPSQDKNNPAEVIAVNDFNFEIPDGRLVSLLGPSGCGKSTALNLISGLLEPTEGRIFFGEEDVTEVPVEYRGIGLVFQNYALYPHMTVYQNIAFPLENLKKDQKLSKEQIREKVMEAARLVQIEPYMDRRPGELSGGQQQRVAIARALVKMPKVLLLDEPLSNLDARLRIQTREEISRIQKETGITTIFVTHDQDEAMSISDLIVLMKDGSVHQIDAPQKVYDDPVDLFVAKFLGVPPINVFRGKVAGGKVFLGEEAVLPAEGIRDGLVWVGIRPEGFVLEENGPLTLQLKKVEVMGRDVSVVGTHPDCENAFVRSIISSEDVGRVQGPQVRFALKKNKVFLFDRETEERLK